MDLQLLSRLLQLYKSVIRFRLDYGAPINNLASKFVLKLLDPIKTHSPRLALGTFPLALD